MIYTIDTQKRTKVIIFWVSLAKHEQNELCKLIVNLLLLFLNTTNYENVTIYWKKKSFDELFT